MKCMLFYILLGCSLIVLNACNEEFLYNEPPGKIISESLNTKESVDKLLIGAYTLVDGTGVRAGWPGGLGYPSSPRNWVWDCASDDAAKGTTRGDYAAGGEIERYEVLPTNGTLNSKWVTLYDGIARSNDVLRTLKLVKESGSIADNEVKLYEGQAKFLRGFYHFRLQRMHYQVPYITEDIEEPELVPNDRVIWDDIESDLKFAIDHLPESWPGEPGRATKYAAMAIKAYVHLHQEEFSEAKVLLDNIINSRNFSLVDKFQDNFNVTTENNVESIFEIQSSVNDGTGGYNGNPDSWTTNPYNPYLPTCCGMYQPTQDLVNAFQVNSDGLPLLGLRGPKYNEENLENDMGIQPDEHFVPTNKFLDPRLDHTVGRRGIPYLDWGVHTGSDWIRDQPNGGPYNTKKQMFSKAEQSVAMDASFTRATGINFRMYRYAHVLLWRAECAVEENDLETARNLINQVRRRASDDFVMGKVSTYSFEPGKNIEVDWTKPAANYLIGEYQSFPNQDYARKAVRMELRLETALEGNRFFDLVRWGIADKVLNDFVANDTKTRDFLKDATFKKGRNDKFPIPQAQIDLQPGVLVQDPNY